MNTLAQHHCHYFFFFNFVTYITYSKQKNKSKSFRGPSIPMSDRRRSAILYNIYYVKSVQQCRRKLLLLLLV